jgi:hypothetical protein
MEKRTLIGGAIAAALLASAAYVYNAKAADLGGNCCADIEERVAELEATVARKGNRKVTLTISGYVSHQVMFWNDGTQKDMYVGDGGNMGSRFRFTGEGKISPTMKAGFTYEFGMQNNRLGYMNQANGGDDLGGNIEVRQSVAYIKDDRLGTVKLGHGSTATDDLILIDLGGTGAASSPDVSVFNGSFFLRSKTLLAGNGLFTWGQMFNGGTSFDTVRRNHFMYETPSLFGFTASIAAGENNFWDAALRYVGEFGSIRVVGGAGYSVDTEGVIVAPLSGTLSAPLPSVTVTGSVNSTKVETMMGSGSIMHVPTGLFLTGAAGQRKMSDATVTTNLGNAILNPGKPMFWHLTGGIARNWFSIGNTVLYGEYQEANDMLKYTDVKKGAGISDSLGTMWGVGIVQNIDAAAMEIFAAYKVFDGKATITDGKKSLAVESDSFSAFMVGTRIQF